MWSGFAVSSDMLSVCTSTSRAIQMYAYKCSERSCSDGFQSSAKRFAVTFCGAVAANRYRGVAWWPLGGEPGALGTLISERRLLLTPAPPVATTFPAGSWHKEHL